MARNKLKEKEKIYRITYKVYPNDRINKVSFHGKLLQPLYVQLIYDRRSTVYKSNMFDLFLKPKFGIRVAGELHPPDIRKVTELDEQLIEYVIDKHPDGFSLELFKREYDYYSRDLLDEMEPAFLRYLQTFLQDEGLPNFADSFAPGSLPIHMGDLVNDLKRALKPELYKRLIDHSFDYAPPYLPLFQFAEELRLPFLGLDTLTLKDWEDKAIRERFAKFMKSHYADKDLSEILEAINKQIMDR